MFKKIVLFVKFTFNTGSTEVTWFKEGKPVKAESALTVDGHVFTLKIGKCSLLDAGEYTITAKNEKAATFCTVPVTVEGNDTIIHFKLDSIYNYSYIYS